MGRGQGDKEVTPITVAAVHTLPVIEPDPLTAMGVFVSFCGAVLSGSTSLRDVVLLLAGRSPVRHATPSYFGQALVLAYVTGLDGTHALAFVVLLILADITIECSYCSSRTLIRRFRKVKDNEKRSQTSNQRK